MRRWRVQAFMPLPSGKEVAYAPRFYRWRWQANAQVRGLRDSFPSGQVRILMIKEKR